MVCYVFFFLLERILISYKNICIGGYVRIIVIIDIYKYVYDIRLNLKDNIIIWFYYKLLVGKEVFSIGL